MKLYLVQHGKALSKEEDPSRSLSDAGVVDVKKAAGLLSTIGVRPDEIHHSGKMRALQTAQIIAEHLRVEQPVIQSEGLSPMDDPALWAENLNEMDGDIMLVGHLPHLAGLAGLILCGSAESRPVIFAMGGVLCLERDEESRWAMDWFVKPGMIG
jgi:phosphohistidine phosphatase